MSKENWITAESSSSDSSEDEEEARKIREAICDESIFRLAESTSGSAASKESSSFEGIAENKPKQAQRQRSGQQKQFLKSNRPKDEDEDRHDNIFQTTPEFRAYVAKQLSKMMDQDLANRFSDVWSLPETLKKDDIGIKLFSHLDSRCVLKENGEGPTEDEAPIPKTSIKVNAKSRKHRISTSSESSEDEKVKACVYTVSDLHQENERLAFLDKPLTADGKTNNINSAKEMIETHDLDSKTSCIDIRVKKKKKKKTEQKREERFVKGIT